MTRLQRMNRRSYFIVASIVSVATLAPTGAAPNGNRLPLRVGFYVAADVPCGEAYTAAMVQIMGDRIEAGGELCTIRSLSRHGTSFTATEACEDTTTGAKRSGTMRMVIADDQSLQQQSQCSNNSCRQAFAKASLSKSWP